jgi:hypothetical protein
MSEDINDETLQVEKAYRMFPYLSSFPFSEYNITSNVLEDGIDTQVDPMVAKEASSVSNLEFINFTYQYGEADICFSFYTFDIEFICSVSKKVRKLDAIRENLDIGISSKDADEKLKSIRTGEIFIKKLGPSLLAGESFDGILYEMLNIKDIKIEDSLLDDITKLNNIEYSEVEYKIYSSILDYYDLHLHHIKILLGIVIAYKIH